MIITSPVYNVVMVIRNQMTSALQHSVTVMTTRVQERATDGTAAGKRLLRYGHPFGHRPPRHQRSSYSRKAAAIGRRKTVDARNAIIIIIIIFLPRPTLTVWAAYRTVYYTKMATANCELDYDSRYWAAATVENNIILLMNRNPFGRQSLCISRN